MVCLIHNSVLFEPLSEYEITPSHSARYHTRDKLRYRTLFFLDKSGNGTTVSRTYYSVNEYYN